MTIDPNLVVQLIIMIGNILLQMQKNQQQLEGKNEEELKALLKELNDQMMNQPDLHKE